MESLCGLELRCSVQSVPPPRRGRRKDWQIACHVLWLFSLLPRTTLSPNPLHLSQEGSVLYPRSFPLIRLFSSLSSNHLLLWLLGSAPPPPRSLLGPAHQSTGPPLPLSSGPSGAHLLEVLFLQWLPGREVLKCKSQGGPGRAQVQLVNDS